VLLASSLTVGVTEAPSTRTVQLSSVYNRPLGIVTLQKPVVPFSTSTLNCIEEVVSGLKLKSEAVELLKT